MKKLQSLITRHSLSESLAQKQSSERQSWVAGRLCFSNSNVSKDEQEVWINGDYQAVSLRQGSRFCVSSRSPEDAVADTLQMIEKQQTYFVIKYK